MTPLNPSAASFAVAFEGAVWKGVATRAQLLPDLPSAVLLHAGPPFETEVPAPVLQAATLALQYEGRSVSFAETAHLLQTGALRLAPAQDHGVVTPLAQVVSASMPLAVVSNGQAAAFAPLVEGPSPALRFGTGGSAALERLMAVSTMAIDRLAAVLHAHPVNLHDVASQALMQGDECHGRTGAANEALLNQMPWLVPQDRDRIRANPSFVLPLLMAAASAALRARPDGIVAVGGNGQSFGVRLSSTAGWRQVAADSPCGTRFAQFVDARALGAIGDSAVIDFCGLGAQAFEFAPALLAELRASLPADVLDRRHQVLSRTSGLVSCLEVITSRKAPLVNLAILDSGGENGLIGRGSYEVPTALFNPL